MNSTKIYVSSFDSLDAIPTEVIERFKYNRQQELFISYEWLKCLDETVLHGERKIQIYVARTIDQTPIGAGFFGNPRGTRHLLSFTNFYSLDFRPAIVPPSSPKSFDQSAIVRALIKNIAQDRPAWRTLGISYLRSDRPDAAVLHEALRMQGFLTVQTRQYENWYLETHGVDFDDYFAARPSQLRNTITRKEKKIRKSHALDIRIFTENNAELDIAIQDYVKIYNSSWKTPEPYPLFIPTFVRLCADLAILRLGVAYLDKKAVAAQIWLVSNDRATIYKLAYDEAFAELSVGAVLSRELFRRVLDIDKVKEIDYGIGSEPYKREWMSSVRYFDQISAYNLKTIVGIAGATKQVLRAATRSVASMIQR